MLDVAMPLLDRENNATMGTQTMRMAALTNVDYRTAAMASFKLAKNATMVTGIMRTTVRPCVVEAFVEMDSYKRERFAMMAMLI